MSEKASSFFGGRSVRCLPGKSNCEISQQIEGFDVFSGVIGNVEFQGIRGIRNDDSTVLKEKDGEGYKNDDGTG